jgi:hypothetical protein
MLRVFRGSIASKKKLAASPEASRETLFAAACLLIHNSYEGFKVDVRRSNVPNSGDGVFVRGGNVRAGQPVCLYAGSYYPPPPPYSLIASDGSTVTPLSLQKHKHEKNQYLLHCNSIGGYLDGKDTIGMKDSFPFAVAQFVNHPPDGMQPNVCAVDFYWKHALELFCNDSHSSYSATSVSKDINLLSELANQLNPIGGGPWYFDPGVEEIVELSPNASPLVAAAFVALTDIKDGDELFFDYRYGPKEGHPPWYTPVRY